MPRTAKLFQNGSSQAVRLPAEFRFDGSEVEIVREGDRVILSPVQGDPLANFLRSGQRMSADYMIDVTDLPVQEREGF